MAAICERYARALRLFPLFFLLLFFGVGQEGWAAFSRSDFRINKKQIQVLKIEFSGKGFAALSAHLYGGDSSHAKRLKKLNPQGVSSGSVIRYSVPQYRVRSGDTFQKVGALLAGGSAKSYFKILSINRQVKNPNLLLSGSWVNLERIPTPQERKAWQALWDVADQKISSEEKTAAGCSVVSCRERILSSVFEPRTAAERRDLVVWYLERLESAKDLGRMDAMVEGLSAQGDADWNTRYVVGKHYFQTERPVPAIQALGLALKDEKAPIQVGLLYLRANRMAKKNLDPAVLEKLFQRYPSLQAIDAADAAE